LTFEDATDDCQWEIAGDFSKISYFVKEIRVNRSFSITPRSERYNIQKISVYGYADGNIVISVKMHQPAKHLIRELFQANLIDKEDYFQQFISTDKNNLLLQRTAERILSKIQTKQQQ
jgi:uncharacterized ubiquitin-like protein YukD